MRCCNNLLRRCQSGCGCGRGRGLPHGLRCGCRHFPSRGFGSLCVYDRLPEGFVGQRCSLAAAVDVQLPRNTLQPLRCAAVSVVNVFLQLFLQGKNILQHLLVTLFEHQPQMRTVATGAAAKDQHLRLYPADGHAAAPQQKAQKLFNQLAAVSDVGRSRAGRRCWGTVRPRRLKAVAACVFGTAKKAVQ